MGRVGFLTLLIYCYGDPGFNGHRPASLDQPMLEFHRTVNKAGRDVQRAIVAFDDLVPRVRRIGDQLHALGRALAPS